MIEFAEGPHHEPAEGAGCQRSEEHRKNGGDIERSTLLQTREGRNHPWSQAAQESRQSTKPITPRGRRTSAAVMSVILPTCARLIAITLAPPTGDKGKPHAEPPFLGFRCGFTDLHARRVIGLWQLPGRWAGGKAPGADLIGVPAGAVAAVLIAHEPVDGAQREDRRAEREDLQRLRAVQVEDDQLADDGQHGEQDHRPHLHDARAAVRGHQQRALELQRDDDREDHAEHGLEDHVIRRIKDGGDHQAVEDLEDQVPDRGHDDDGNQQGQDGDDGVFELLVEGEQAPPSVCGRPRPRHRQNIPFALAAFSGMGWTTSQCSTILPSSSLKMSTMALPRVPGSRTAWTCRITWSPAANTRLISLRELWNFSLRNPRNALSPSGPSAAFGLCCV